MTIGLSRLTERTKWGDAMGRALAAELVGKRSLRECIVLAVVKRRGRRGLLQGRSAAPAGMVAGEPDLRAGPFRPKREMLPWTGIALAAGLVLGALFESTGNLVAPIVAHVGINAVNLRRLVVRYG